MYHNYTSEEKENMMNWINTSINLFIERDPDMLSPNSIQTNIKIENQKELNRELHEITINHRLALYLENKMDDFGFSSYNCDIEYNRFINQKKMVVSIKTGTPIEVRPDIIVHKRTRIHELIPHLLVVEAKKNSNNKKDRNHIRDIMSDFNYQYKFGLLISYYESKATINCELLILENSKFISQKFKVEKNKFY